MSLQTRTRRLPPAWCVICPSRCLPSPTSRNNGEAPRFTPPCYRLRLLYPNRELTLVKNARVFHSHRETIGGLYRQFRRYGHSDVVLAKRYGKCWRYHVARLGVDLVRLVLAPVMSLLYLPWSMLKQDWLFAAAPWFRAVRIVGRRVGQLQAILGHHHRT